MFLKLNAVGIIISSGMLATVPVPDASNVTPVLYVGYVDTSGNRQWTSVLDNVTTITGVAPFAAELDGGSTVSTATDSDTADEAFQALGFLFNYGEAKGTTWSTTGRPFDTDRGGPISAHVWDTPGTYQVRMWARNAAGDQALIRFNVVVTDPGAGTNMTSGVIPTFASNTVYNAPAGGTWGNITSQLNGLHNVIIRKTGSGADPVFGTVSLDNRNEPNTAITRTRGVRFQNCDIANLTYGNVGFDCCAAVGGRVRVLTLQNMFYAADQVIVQGMTSQQAQNVRMARGLILQNTGSMGDSGGGYVLIGEIRGLHLKGVTLTKSSTGQHNTRGVFKNSSFRNCVFNNTASGSVSYLKLQGWECMNAGGDTPDAWPDTDMVVTAAGGRRLGLPLSRVCIVDCVFGLSGSSQPTANIGIAPENNIGTDPDQGSELTSIDHCITVWTTQWYTVDLSGRYLACRDYKLNNGAGATLNFGAGTANMNRVPPEWDGPYYTTGTRPVPVP